MQNCAALANLRRSAFGVPWRLNGDDLIQQLRLTSESIVGLEMWCFWCHCDGISWARSWKWDSQRSADFFHEQAWSKQLNILCRKFWFQVPNMNRYEIELRDGEAVNLWGYSQMVLSNYVFFILVRLFPSPIWGHNSDDPEHSVLDSFVSLATSILKAVLEQKQCWLTPPSLQEKRAVHCDFSKQLRFWQVETAELEAVVCIKWRSACPVQECYQQAAVVRCSKLEVHQSNLLRYVAESYHNRLAATRSSMQRFQKVSFLKLVTR